MTNKLAQIADEYFATINPIAAKIKLDIIDISNAYEHLWNEFSESEQSDVINETLIKPEIVLKYFDSFLTSASASATTTTTTTASTTVVSGMDKDLDSLIADDETTSIANRYLFDGKNLLTYAHCKTGRKMNQDDVCGIYRDEHSQPFSMRTKSQIDFNAFDVENAKNNNNNRVLLKTPLNSAKMTNAMNSKTEIDSPMNRSHKNKNNNSAASAVAAAAVATAINNNQNPYLLTDELPLCRFNTDQTPQQQQQQQQQQMNLTKGGNILSKLMTSITSGTGSSGHHNHHHHNGSNSRKNFDFDDQEQLVSNICLGMQSASLQSASEEEDEKLNFGEFSSLLETNTEMKKAYDFLNNW